jgi:hypothetical protein
LRTFIFSFNVLILACANMLLKRLELSVAESGSRSKFKKAQRGKDGWERALGREVVRIETGQKEGSAASSNERSEASSVKMIGYTAATGALCGELCERQ